MVLNTDFILKHLPSPGNNGDEDCDGGETPPCCCYHGSTREAFRNLDFRDAVLDYVEIMKKSMITTGEWSKVQARMMEFNDRNEKSLRDEEFWKFVFALGVKMYLKSSSEEEEEGRDVDGGESGSSRSNSNVNRATLRCLVRLGIVVKYDYLPLLEGKDVGPGTIYYDKLRKRNHDSMTERGLINCLSRETQNTSCCGCMTAARRVAKTMTKLGFCNGCNKTFPKRSVSVCSRCRAVNYCSTECQLKDWKTGHKETCSRLRWRTTTCTSATCSIMNINENDENETCDDSNKKSGTSSTAASEKTTGELREEKGRPTKTGIAITVRSKN